MSHQESIIIIIMDSWVLLLYNYVLNIVVTMATSSHQSATATELASDSYDNEGS